MFVGQIREVLGCVQDCVALRNPHGPSVELVKTSTEPELTLTGGACPFVREGGRGQLRAVLPEHTHERIGRAFRDEGAEVSDQGDGEECLRASAQDGAGPACGAQAACLPESMSTKLIALAGLIFNGNGDDNLRSLDVGG